jgi:hypothetical protein
MGHASQLPTGCDLSVSLEACHPRTSERRRQHAVIDLYCSLGTVPLALVIQVDL